MYRMLESSWKYANCLLDYLLQYLIYLDSILQLCYYQRSIFIYYAVFALAQNFYRSLTGYIAYKKTIKKKHMTRKNF